MKTWRFRAGLGLLAGLTALSLLHPLLERLGLPCPLGMDPGLRDLTVCALTFQSFWRSALIGLVGGGASVLIGLFLARLARRWGGWVEEGLLKLGDGFYVLPNVLIVILIGFVFKRLRAGGLLPFLDRSGLVAEAWPIFLLTASLVAMGWAGPMRMIHNRLVALEEEDFVQASLALGATRRWVQQRHLLPLLRPYVLGLVLLRIPATILAESVVSFLGFGLPPDHPSLGSYLSQNSRYFVEKGPGSLWLPVPAWGLLLLLVLGFQWAGSALAGPGRDGA
jgi:peptide/nickel transport system permease protein